MANETFSSIYYEVREPDEYGNYPECPEISKEFLISSKLFRIRKEDLPDLLEDIKADDPFELKAKQGEVKERDTTTRIAHAPIETPLSYYKITGKFRYGDSESIPISKSSRHKVRQQAEKLMKWWKEGKPCPQSEIVRDPIKKIPRSVYDNTSTIRKTLLEYLNVNMPQCANDEYPPPSEPKHFKTVS